MVTQNKMKILNLYAGIGGNRKLWGDKHEIIAVENNSEIAKIYQDFFPNDKVIITDAHQYLLKHFQEFDFIWSSPPCPTHSDIRRAGVHRGRNKAVYPEMKLYEEIILLKHFVKLETKWVVENVVGYYKPLIKPFKAHRHFFWSNFIILDKEIQNNRIHNEIVGSKPIYGFDISKTDIDEKRKVLRNMVDPEVGLHILDCAFKDQQKTL